MILIRMLVSGTRRKAGMVFIFITLFIDVLGIGIIIPILPELIKLLLEGDVTQAGYYYGFIIAVYALMQFLFAPLVGALSDRFGRRPIILLSLFGLGADYLIQAWAPSVTWLFVGRLIAGVMGASLTAANAYIADVSTPETRAGNYGLAGVAFGLGFIFGPAIGGFLGGINLRLPFIVAALLALINWMYGFFVLPESLPADRRSSVSWHKLNPLSSILRLREYPLVAGLSMTVIFTSLAQRGLESVWVLYTSYRYGWNEQTNGFTLALVGVMAVIVQGLILKPVIARFGERRTIVLGLAVSMLALLGYGMASEGWIVLIIIIVGSLSGVALPAIQGLVAGAVNPSEQGAVQGALTSLISLTSVFAPLIFTAGLFSFFTSDKTPVLLPGAPFYLASFLILISLIVLRRIFHVLPSGSFRET